ncbi:hypothetical protein TPHA_0M01780 [Tetrapisispora phaffii CBS 4417]|uniref:Uncharacterized protein n=1 Tax=Tetrapisispora phaffii (strain ATCC 24235 / CBS 4417 / NBRC 1672 / NRRL Y-8282 / UCD 70-5) TaxID=1071381 RepID=G8C0N8_TETPH|nr:hypothetical protein TPHA_0M01780 [Tetrapisispora phaffii CBS 4417]CCE65753.1 hypothetical protein TPHA_0M01780 [Tetrapisispora phaffii CBS 4417]
MQDHQNHHVHGLNIMSLMTSNKLIDTFAIFIILLNLNNFYLLVLSFLFIISKRYTHFKSDVFITILLYKIPSYNDLHLENFKKGILNDNKTISKNLKDNKHIIEFLVNIGIASFLRTYFKYDIIKYIQKFALSIIASSMVNQQSNRLLFAVLSCLMIITISWTKEYAQHGLFLQTFLRQRNELYKLLGENIIYFENIKQRTNLLMNSYNNYEITNPFMFNTEVNNYIDILFYLLSFHLIVVQLLHDVNAKLKGSENQKFMQATDNYTQQGSKYNTNNTDDSIRGGELITVFSDAISNYNFCEQVSASYNSQTVAMTDPIVANGFNSKQKGNRDSSNLKDNTNIIKNKFYQLNIDSSRLGSDESTLNEVNNGNFNDFNAKDNNSRKNNYSNEKFNIQITETTNIENFIRYLFQWKRNYSLSPLWSMFFIVRATIFEKKYLKGMTTTKDNINNINNTKHSESSQSNQNSDSNNLNAEVVKKSLFNTTEADNSMALISRSASDEYKRLNIISTNENIFNRGNNDYKLCIINISCNSITFHIENLHEGQLIVLVNGVIWSEVSCALLLNREGEEYVEVNGLVPLSSYDIQFINRLEDSFDYLISDVVVRTSSALGSRNGTDDSDQSSISESLTYGRKSNSTNMPASMNNMYTIDFSFPSFYHRKFLSPLLTLKHSVLTTNTNLAEERVKLRKSKKEISKKLNAIKQEIDNCKSKIDQNIFHDEKSTTKMDNLKISLKKSEEMNSKLEQQLKEISEFELKTEERYLKEKDLHLKRVLEYSKLEENLRTSYEDNDKKLSNLKSDELNLISKLEKLKSKYDKLEKEANQDSTETDELKSRFINKRLQDRSKREEARIKNSTEFQFAIKALEQDISRIESENQNFQRIIPNY